MKIEFLITPDDIQESLDAQTGNKKRATPVLAFLGMSPLFLVCVVGAIPRRLIFGHTLVFAVTAPVQNLWVTLAPSLCLVSFLSGATVFQAWKKRLAAKSIGANKRMSKKISVASMWLFYLPLAWIIPALWSPLSIEWAPTVSQILCAAFAPWALWLAVMGYSGARRGKHVAEETWRKRPSLHRPQRVEVTDEGITNDDGVASHKIKWTQYKRYGETINLLLLTNVDDVTGFLPKRAVPDDQAMDELKMLIHNNVPEGEFLSKPNAFPVILPVVEMAREK